MGPKLVWLVSLHKGGNWMQICLQGRQHEETQGEDSGYKPRREACGRVSPMASEGTSPAGSLIWDFQSPEWWESTSVVWACGALLRQPQQASNAGSHIWKPSFLHVGWTHDALREIYTAGLALQPEPMSQRTAHRRASSSTSPGPPLPKVWEMPWAGTGFSPEPKPQSSRMLPPARRQGSVLFQPQAQNHHSLEPAWAGGGAVAGRKPPPQDPWWPATPSWLLWGNGSRHSPGPHMGAGEGSVSLRTRTETHLKGDWGCPTHRTPSLLPWTDCQDRTVLPWGHSLTFLRF